MHVTFSWNVYIFSCQYNSTKTNHCRLTIEIKISKTLYYFIYRLMHQWLEISSVAQSRLTLCNPMDCSTLGFPVQHQLQELTQTRPSSRWCSPTISSSAVPFSSCLQSFPASGSFPVSQLFPSGGQNIRVSTSVLHWNTQDWSPLGWTDWVSLQSKGLSRVFSITTVQKHQFFGSQLSL